MKAAHGTVLAAQDLERVDAPLAHLATHELDGLRLAIVGLLDVGPLRPRVSCRALLRRAGEELELAHGARALAHGGAQAVVARVAAANDHDVLARGIDRRRAAVEHASRGAREVVHGVRHATACEALGKARGPKPARLARTGRHHDGVELADQRLGHGGVCRVHAQAELDPELLHEPHATRDHGLVELHVGDAVHEQATRAVVALHHRDARTPTRELPGAHKAGRPRSHHGHARGVRRGRLKARGAAVRPLPVADGTLVVVNRLGLVGAPQVAGGLAQRGAHAARELGHGRGERQPLGRALPLPAVDEVVPLGDEVVQRAAARARMAKRDARLAEGHAAHHAAACLHLLPLGAEQLIELVVVLRALGHVAQPMGLPAVLEKRSWLAHG